MTRSIGVLGAGSWGTALAVLLARNGLATTLWGHEPEHMAQLSAKRCNESFLPGIQLPDALMVTDNLSQAVRNQTTLLIAVPSHAFRATLQTIRPELSVGVRIAWATKGFDAERNCLLHKVVFELLSTSTPVAVLSGPTFARELGTELPTAITVASPKIGFATELAEMLRNSRFRAYTSDDIIGVQIGGATKNVLAIATGVADGLRLGANTRAALITRGLAEMMRLGLTLGGKTETFMGLAGMGDLVLTCTDDQSRNRRMGLAIGQGMTVAAAQQQIGQEVEGVAAARKVYEIASKHKIDMPITEQVYRVLYESLPPATAVNNLLTRKPKAENG